MYKEHKKKKKYVQVKVIPHQKKTHYTPIINTNNKGTMPSPFLILTKQRIIYITFNPQRANIDNILQLWPVSLHNHQSIVPACDVYVTDECVRWQSRDGAYWHAGVCE
jgi:hypothetical protein